MLAVEAALFDNQRRTVADWEPLFRVIRERVEMIDAVDWDIIKQSIGTRLSDAFYTYQCISTPEMTLLNPLLAFATELVGEENML